MLSQQKDESCLGNKQTSTRLKERSNKKTSGGSNRCKFVGVRQRPSGKWVAEIKNTTQKIRIWLGTFHTAEEAARAYDEAACLLRGSNTRTNFVADYRGSGTNNSALSLKIRNLINQKKSCSLLHNQSAPAPAPTAAAPAPGACVIKADYGNPSVWNHLTGIDSSSSSNDYSWVTGRPTAGFWLDAHTIGSGYERSVFNDGYRPDMSICNSNQLQSSTDQIFAAPGNSWPLTGGEESQQQQQQQLLFPSTAADEAFDLHPETGNISLTSSEGGNDQSDIAEFERIKVERQISATLYAMNGVNDYLENVSATSDNSSSNVPSWDLPMFYQSFCLS